jgi:choline dehydrogenase-like flavoprotein
MTVGGSSAVNGQFFDRGSKHDYNDWSAIGSPEFDDSGDKWNWEGIFPYFKKSVLFHEPPKEQVEEYGYTWDMSAFGGTTPIHSSFAAFQFPIQREALHFSMSCQFLSLEKLCPNHA